MKVIGHRGAMGESPENTLDSIDFALSAGVKGVEIDVHKSLSGELVVIHDFTLERTTNGKGLVSESSLEYLKSLNVGVDFDQSSKLSISTLEEVFYHLDSLNLADDFDLFVELKAPNLEQDVVELINHKSWSFNVIVKSFNHLFLQKIKSIDSQIPCACLIYGRPINPHLICTTNGFEILSINAIFLDGDIVRECHQYGVKLCAWNFNDKLSFKQAMATKVDWIFTDYPKMISDFFSHR